MNAYRDSIAVARTGVVAFALAAFAGSVGTTSADAALFWSESDPAVQSRPAPSQLRKRKPPRRAGEKLESQTRENAKPQGPLVIAISIDQQRVKVYDANGVFAESPVSTGMRGHATPMGVFSVIQKHKWHRSNIYSGAPMPYMQRVTWSGVAMHAGVLPGYPASHGCIRMPMAFAVKMWGWTRMGARVIITPGVVSPSDFMHPLLTAQKPATPAAVVASAVVVASAPVVSAPVPSISSTPDATAERTQTADASGDIPDVAKTDAATATAAEVVEAPPAATEPAAKDQVTKDQVTKDQARSSDPEKPADPEKSADPEKPTATRPEPTAVTAQKRTGQIAAFVSRKDSRLYVRQNFAPLFDVPVTIAPSDRPLGTHVFTARADKDDARLFHWSVVSLPAVVRRVDRREVGDAASRRRKSTGAIEMTSAVVPDSAAEALDRLAIPDDAMARLTEALTTGGSLVVSDQGIAGGETGEGTDFIVSLR